MLENMIISISICGLLVSFFTEKLMLKKSCIYKYFIMTLFSSAVFFLLVTQGDGYACVPASCFMLFIFMLIWCEGSLMNKVLWSLLCASIITLVYLVLRIVVVLPSTMIFIMLFQVSEIVFSILCLNRRGISALGSIPPAIFTIIIVICIYLSFSSSSMAMLWCVFAVSLLLYILYETMRRSYEKSLESQTGLAQNDLIEKHYNEVQNIYLNMRGWRHDYHNHLQTIKGHIALNQMQELNEYLGMLEKDLSSVDTIMKTGNLMLDAILNSKVSIARNRNINVNVKAQTPEKLLVSEIDLCVIIGNLIDNAAEACLKIENTRERFIRIYIGVLKKQLYISVTNSMGGTLNKIGGEYFTTKDKSHGHGIKRINAIVNKYNGYINRQNEIDVFATEIMLPL